MQDVYAEVNKLDDNMQERLAGVLETRGADRQQQAMRRAFFADIAFPMQARVLDVGCGTGVLTRMLARRPNVVEVIGVDTATLFIGRARELASDLPNVTFQEANAKDLPFENGTFDVVAFDSTLSHLPGPDRALAEAFRVLRPGGWLATIDGDYATATVGLGDHDPLQVCVDYMMANSVTDRWLMRRLPGLVRECGFEEVHFRSHGFVETTDGEYMLSIVERGADMLCAVGQIGADLAEAVKAEARRRASEDAFFGHIAYASLTARKP